MLLQGPIEGRVPEINIFPELDPSIVGQPRCPVKEMDAQGIAEVDDACFPFLYRGQDLLSRPFRIIPEEIFGEFEGPFDPDAARAEIPHGPAEKPPLRRVVQVDVELVGER